MISRLTFLVVSITLWACHVLQQQAAAGDPDESERREIALSAPSMGGAPKLISGAKDGPVATWLEFADKDPDATKARYSLSLSLYDEKKNRFQEAYSAYDSAFGIRREEISVTQATISATARDA